MKSIIAVILFVSISTINPQVTQEWVSGYNGPGNGNDIARSIAVDGSSLTLSLPNSRMQESEADNLGLIFMSMAGYDPAEAIPFWQRMSIVNTGSKMPEFLSIHPMKQE